MPDTPRITTKLKRPKARMLVFPRKNARMPCTAFDNYNVNKAGKARMPGHLLAVIVRGSGGKHARHTHTAPQTLSSARVAHRDL